MDKDDIEAIKEKKEALSEAIYAVTTKMYQKAASEQGGSSDRYRR